MSSTEINKSVQIPNCIYEVLDAGPTSGRPVKYAKIGDAVYHKWTCQGQFADQYCMTVHSCFVDDGHGTVTHLLDVNGLVDYKVIFRKNCAIVCLTSDVQRTDICSKAWTTLTIL